MTLPDDDFATLAARAAERYRVGGRWAEGMARGKMTGDPAYSRVLQLIGELGPVEPTLLDLGCGEGYLLALVRQAHPSSTVVGVDHDARRTRLGQAALAGDEQVQWMVDDARRATLPRCDLVACLDVLHYMPPPEQDGLLAQLAGSLAPGGVLLLRDGEAGTGWRHWLTEASERLMVALGRHQGQGVYFRSRDEMVAALAGCGLDTTVEPCRGGTPFANVLYIARHGSNP